MAGRVATPERQGLEKAVAAVDRLVERHPAELSHGAGSVIESRTHRLNAREETSPAGDEWPEWADAYASTRHSGHTLPVNHPVSGGAYHGSSDNNADDNADDPGDMFAALIEGGQE